MITGSGRCILAQEYARHARDNAAAWRVRLASNGVDVPFIIKCQGLIAMHEQLAQYWQAEVDTYHKETIG